MDLHKNKYTRIHGHTHKTNTHAYMDIHKKSRNRQVGPTNAIMSLREFAGSQGWQEADMWAVPSLGSFPCFFLQALQNLSCVVFCVVVCGACMRACKRGCSVKMAGLNDGCPGSQWCSICKDFRRNHAQHQHPNDIRERCCV